MKILICGGSGGIGRGLLEVIPERYPDAELHATWRSDKPALDSVQWHQADLSDEDSVADLAVSLGSVDWVVNCVGVLHRGDQQPEKTIRQFDRDFFLMNIEANILPTLLLAKHFANALRKAEAGRFATVSARVGSIDENALGGWVSYRASKAALNMALKTIAIEWRRSLPRASVAALHPGTTDTTLSRPFQGGVAPEKLFTRQQTAGYLLDVMAQLTPENSGRFFSWDGRELPW